MTFRQDELKAWLFDSALPLWWEQGADHARGGFHELIGMDGLPVEANRRARVQARQIFVYAYAGVLGWSGPWREAAAHGLSFFLGKYERPDGLFRTLVSATGEPVDDDAYLYDQAFALFALAAAAQALPEREDIPTKALALLNALQVRRHAAGGFVEASPDQPYQSNPHMHLFEASLAWEAISPEPVWSALADEVAGLCLTRFIDGEGGYLREFFNAAWAPADGVMGRIVEPGHQFEWAWLLQRWSRLRGRADAHAAAMRLFQIGVEHGLDPARGVAVNQLLDDLSVHDASARLWPQTERIKAAKVLMDQADPSQAQAFADQVAGGVDGLMLYFDTPISGLWRDKFKADGTFVEEPAPASSLYHIICAIAEIQP